MNTHTDSLQLPWLTWQLIAVISAGNGRLGRAGGDVQNPAACPI